ncbi:hypothetical protein NKG94_42370 [Micromonospora sp. M12]
MWLDGKAKAALADTTAQIGAPAACRRWHRQWCSGRRPGQRSGHHPPGPREPGRGVPELHPRPGCDRPERTRHPHRVHRRRDRCRLRWQERASPPTPIW